MKVKVYTKCIELRYFNTFFSKATHVVFALTIVLYFVPFILAYLSKGFWLKRVTFYEQPDIKYKYEYIFIAETDKLNMPIFCSNIFDTSSINENIETCDDIIVREIDNNGDTKVDELNFSITINNLQDLKILGVSLILPFDYKLYTECYIQMQTLGIIQHFHSTPGYEFEIYGDVQLSQTESLSCSKYSIFDIYNSSGIRKTMTDLNNLFTEEYFTRNISTTIQTKYVVWKSGAGSTFEMKVHLRFPEHEIYYTPRFWQVVKFAWIQYLSLYILTAWFIDKLKDYIFSNRFVSYYIDSNSHNKIK